MNPPPVIARLTLALLAGMLPASAAPSPASPDPEFTTRPPSPSQTALTSLAEPPHPTELPPSPVALFRQLLNTNAQGRAMALRARPEPQHRMLVAKLREYAELPEQEREQRLRATEYRWYLRQLIDLPSTNRTPQLASLPEDFRDVLGGRLARWDALPEATRRELLSYDHALSWLARSQSSNSTTPASLDLPSDSRNARQLESELAHWHALPREHRDELCRQFEQFFELPPRAREKTLAALAGEERDQIEDTLRAFQALPPTQRRLCLISFRKFASMSPADRASFLRSAERWREMSAAERQEWRQLVTQLPPLPPGFDSPPSLPPSPPWPVTITGRITPPAAAK